MPISPDLINTILVVVEVALAVAGGFLAALWISLVIWTFRDIRSRSRDVFAQLLATLLVLIFNVPGLLIYLLLRPPERLADAYERALEEEALLQDIEERALCPGCKRQIEPDFILCPSCHTPLRKHCVECNRILHLKWNVCPYCGAVQEERPAETPPARVPRRRLWGRKPEPAVPPATSSTAGRRAAHTQSEPWPAGRMDALDAPEPEASPEPYPDELDLDAEYTGAGSEDEFGPDQEIEDDLSLDVDDLEELQEGDDRGRAGL